MGQAFADALGEAGELPPSVTLSVAGSRTCEEPGTFPKIPCSSFLACYFGIVQGNSPGWSRAHESPLHVEFGSSGGPHHGERSSHQYSPVTCLRR